MLTGKFWFGVALVYAGLLALFLDLLFEPDLRRKWKIAIGAGIFGTAAIFSWKAVFVAAPIRVWALETDGQYPPGTTIAGLRWRPEFTRLDVDISNPTNHFFRDLNLVIRPTSAVAKIAQLTDISGVTIEDKNNLDEETIDPGTKTAIPLVLIATDDGYRVRCAELAPHQDLRLVLALADMREPDLVKDPNGTPVQIVRDHNFMMQVHFDDFGRSWYGYKDGDDFAPRPTSSEWLWIEGTYVAAYRKRSLSRKVTIGGIVTPQ